MDETEKAVIIISSKHEHDNAAAYAKNVRRIMNEAFEEATVSGYERLGKTIGKLPDEGDRHVMAAAVKSRADFIVTENLKDFPRRILSKYGITAKSSDAFIADAIDLSPSLAIATINRMLLRLGKSERDPESLFSSMEKCGLTQTAELLKVRINLA